MNNYHISNDRNSRTAKYRHTETKHKDKLRLDRSQAG